MQEGAGSSGRGVPQYCTVTGRKVRLVFTEWTVTSSAFHCDSLLVVYMKTHVSVVRLELENRLSSMQQQISLKDAAVSDQMAEWEEHLSNAKHREESASQELQQLRQVM